MDRGSSTSRPAALTAIYIGDEIHDVRGLLACARNCAKLHRRLLHASDAACRSSRAAARAELRRGGLPSARVRWSTIEVIAAMWIKRDGACERQSACFL